VLKKQFPGKIYYFWRNNHIPRNCVLVCNLKPNLLMSIAKLLNNNAQVNSQNYLNLSILSIVNYYTNTRPLDNFKYHNFNPMNYEIKKLCSSRILN
jgi:hypothetical protein